MGMKVSIYFHLLVTLIHFCCFDNKHLILLFINKWKRKTATSQIYVYLGFRPGSISHLLRPLPPRVFIFLTLKGRSWPPSCAMTTITCWAGVAQEASWKEWASCFRRCLWSWRHSFKSRLCHFLDMWLRKNILSEPQLAHVWNRNLNSAFIRWLWDSTEKN